VAAVAVVVEEVAAVELLAAVVDVVEEGEGKRCA
jgi:hypothetical protein